MFALAISFMVGFLAAHLRGAVAIALAASAFAATLLTALAALPTPDPTRIATVVLCVFALNAGLSAPAIFAFARARQRPHA